MSFITKQKLITNEIQKQYVKYRKNGTTRDEAIRLLRQLYVQELQDTDDRIFVLIGLSLSLSKNNELISSIANETLEEIYRVTSNCKLDTTSYARLEEIEQCLKDKSKYGEESSYKHVSKFVPDWKVGDTFAHKLTYPTAESLGINGWYILFYKVGEHRDKIGDVRQLMCVTLCPSNKLPTCDNDLQKIGFLCLMDTLKPEYLAQIIINSKKNEASYELSKIGCFPNVSLPEGLSEENPLTAMPIFLRSKWSEPWLAYERQICRIYKKYGHML